MRLFRTSPKRLLRIILILAGFLPLVFASHVSANIDWGGGSTRFFGESGDVLTPDTGCATLITVSEGDLIDFRNYIPERPRDLVTVGAELHDGTNLNRVVAETCSFFSGYLLYSAIPDLTHEELIALGVREGEQLFLVVWDRGSFVDGRPSDRSFYTAQPLYAEGDDSAPVYVRLNEDSVYARVAYPSSGLASDQTLAAALKAGHNTFGDFQSWLLAQSVSGELPDSGDLLTVDSDRDGRSDFEEYVLQSLPRLEVTAESAAPTVSAVIEGAALAAGAETVDAGPAFVVELRGSDASLSYIAHASVDLRAWETSEIYFDQGTWRSAAPEFDITGSEYVGGGVWSVAMQYRGEHSEKNCFYKISVD